MSRFSKIEQIRTIDFKAIIQKFCDVYREKIIFNEWNCEEKIANYQLQRRQQATSKNDAGNGDTKGREARGIQLI